ncbi:putative ABC transport system ATP-binding protein [Brevibacterium sp. Mu109]|uniref:ABC transporter ATP-binding protein n=1 Tax=Brevibacterium sp. Mu109 TaxID=1255669 RepID=UPI000C3CA8BD|nr:ABC transporter ATP-binding protein [Brevibacterium sp. Mu109]SMX75254.1 putative ABC transport system ATP-binding protein [Brevibacterium sp. Mu109]
MSPIALHARRLSRTYRTTSPPVHVLDGIDLEVRDGEFIVIMGASGSGKSTLLYCLSGMDRPTGGSVELAGTDLTVLTAKEMSRIRLTRMGFVFQQAHFLANLSIRDNVLLPALNASPNDPDGASSRVDMLLERFGIAELAGRRITQVSGGQIQRASICRALVCSPEILFADEPTGALNTSMTTDVMDALTQVHADGTTLVMVTHEPACAARAERVIYLRDGTVVDELRLGAWTAAEAVPREDRLLAWLRARDF